MEASTTAPAIALKGLNKKFGQVHAVNGIDLEIGTGEIVAFLGPNGAGKTTTLDMVLGLSDPSSGTVDVLGTSAAKAARSGRIAAVLQTGGLLRDLSVRETVTAIASMFKATRRVGEVMERADLTRLARRRVGKCSGGEQQRIKFALALIPDPDVLILDEPTAGMDVSARRHFWDVMRADADAGRTVVFATHYLEEAEQNAQRTVVVNHGRIVADAATTELRASLGGRSVTAVVDSSALEQLHALPSVTRIEVPADGELGAGRIRVRMRSEDSDALAKILLTQLQGSDLRISEPSLETAFTELTSDTDSEPALRTRTQGSRS
jgi:ABC-2 type transport system ATP-binding protein